MNNNKKAQTVTIVVPVYNEEVRIARCLDAIQTQTVMPKEVIVVDNNCTDKTVEIAKTYTFVRVVKEKKQGIAHARNAGFDAVNTDVIGRIDADSVLPNNWVEKILKFYDHPSNLNSAVTGSGYSLNTRFPSKKFYGFMHDLVVFRYNHVILGHYILWGSNMAFLKTQWQDVKSMVHNDKNIHEDIDLSIQLRKIGVKIRYLKSLKVDAELRRVIDNFSELHENLHYWPRTFRVNNNKRWILGLVGVYFMMLAGIITYAFHIPHKLIDRLKPRSKNQ